ncbi:MAG: MFS transporter [Dehalococcoidia bacterium]|nr:MFS transporter [Dehalococcoidia bacterium]
MSDHRPGLRQALDALAYHDFRAFSLSLLFTSLGAQLVQIAVLWQVYELTGSALLIGLTGLARAVPHIILSLVGGVIADRVNRVRLIQIGQAANGLLTLGLALLTVSGHVQVWHLYAVTFLNSAFTALTQPARTAIIPRLVPPGGLLNAIGLNATINQVSMIVGPALAGIAIAAVGLGGVYLANGIFYLIAMMMILGIRTPSTPEATDDTPWRSFMDGLAFVRSRSVIVSLLALDVGATMLGSYRGLLPIFATMLGVGATGFGLLSAAPGVGALGGAALILSLGNMRYKGVYTLFGVLGYSVAGIMLALSPWLLVSLVAAGLLGATNSIQMIPRNTVILTISPDAMRGRVEAFRSMLAGGAPPLGYALAGAVADLWGPATALVAGSVACVFFVGLIALVSPELRDPELGSEVATEPAKPAVAR